MEQNLSTMRLSTEQTPRILHGNAQNFLSYFDERQRVYVRPLVLDAWTQTNLDCEDDIKKRNEELEIEIRKLREQNEALKQIKPTAAIKAIPRKTPEHTSSETPCTSNQAKSSTTSSSKQTESHLMTPSETPSTSNQAKSSTKLSSSHTESHLMNSVDINVTANSAPVLSYKYTLVSNACQPNENGDSELIEVQLAEEDGALDLNKSVDSNRLEICLGEDEPLQQSNQDVAIKIETLQEERKLPLQDLSPMVLKRRKITKLEEHYENNEQCNGYDNQLPVCLAHFNAIQKPNKIEDKIIHNFNSFSPDPQTPLAERNIKERPLEDDNAMIAIGQNGTLIARKDYEDIKWSSASIATRKLLLIIFGRDTLATHSMTGKPSPAFKGLNKPLKKRLDPKVTEDIVYEVSQRCGVPEKDVRTAITTKCADENKMMKQRQLKENALLNGSNKENRSFREL